MLDHISAGRATYVFGIGYRAEEFDHFGLSMSDRGRMADEKLGLLRRLLAGEEVEHGGRRMKVTPRPRTPEGPMILGWFEPCRGPACGTQRPGPARQRRGSGYAGGLRKAMPRQRFRARFRADTRTGRRGELFRGRGCRAAWDEIGKYLLHDAMAYSEWNPDNPVSANMTTAKTVDELRHTSSSHVILSVEEAKQRLAGGEMFNISPLCGGIPPEIAWPYLKRVAELN